MYVFVFVCFYEEARREKPHQMLVFPFHFYARKRNPTLKSPEAAPGGINGAPPRLKPARRLHSPENEPFLHASPMTIKLKLPTSRCLAALHQTTTRNPRPSAQSQRPHPSLLGNRFAPPLGRSIGSRPHWRSGAPKNSAASVRRRSADSKPSTPAELQKIDVQKRTP